MIVLPKHKPDTNPDYGMHKDARGTWTIRWTENGKTRTKSARTKSVFDARKVRDSLYAKLRSERGALVLGTPEHATQGDLYIYERKPYLVKVPGMPAAEVGSRAEARKVRNELVLKKAAMGGAR